MSAPLKDRTNERCGAPLMMKINSTSATFDMRSIPTNVVVKPKPKAAQATPVFHTSPVKEDHKVQFPPEVAASEIMEIFKDSPPAIPLSNCLTVPSPDVPAPNKPVPSPEEPAPEPAHPTAALSVGPTPTPRSVPETRPAAHDGTTCATARTLTLKLSVSLPPASTVDTHASVAAPSTEPRARSLSAGKRLSFDCGRTTARRQAHLPSGARARLLFRPSIQAVRIIPEKETSMLADPDAAARVGAASRCAVLGDCYGDEVELARVISKAVFMLLQSATGKAGIRVPSQQWYDAASSKTLRLVSAFCSVAKAAPVPCGCPDGRSHTALRVISLVLRAQYDAAAVSELVQLHREPFGSGFEAPTAPQLPADPDQPTPEEVLRWNEYSQDAQLFSAELDGRLRVSRQAVTSTDLTMVWNMLFTPLFPSVFAAKAPSGHKRRGERRRSNSPGPPVSRVPPPPPPDRMDKGDLCLMMARGQSMAELSLCLHYLFSVPTSGRSRGRVRHQVLGLLDAMRMAEPPVPADQGHPFTIGQLFQVALYAFVVSAPLLETAGHRRPDERPQQPEAPWQAARVPGSNADAVFSEWMRRVVGIHSDLNMAVEAIGNIGLGRMHEKMVLGQMMEQEMHKMVEKMQKMAQQRAGAPPPQQQWDQEHLPADYHKGPWNRNPSPCLGAVPSQPLSPETGALVPYSKPHKAAKTPRTPHHSAGQGQQHHREIRCLTAPPGTPSQTRTPSRASPATSESPGAGCHTPARDQYQNRQPHYMSETQEPHLPDTWRSFPDRHPAPRSARARSGCRTSAGHTETKERLAMIPNT
eukprot:gene652-2491_t